MLSGDGLQTTPAAAPRVESLQDLIAAELGVPCLEQALIFEGLGCHPRDLTRRGSYALLRVQLSDAERVEIEAWETLSWDSDRPLGPLWRAHRRVAGLAVAHDHRLFHDVSSELQHDASFVRRAILDNSEVISLAPKELWLVRGVFEAGAEVDAEATWRALSATAERPPGWLACLVAKHPQLLARRGFLDGCPPSEAEATLRVGLLDWAGRLECFAREPEGALHLSCDARKPCWDVLTGMMHSLAAAPRTPEVLDAFLRVFVATRDHIYGRHHRPPLLLYAPAALQADRVFLMHVLPELRCVELGYVAAALREDDCSLVLAFVRWQPLNVLAAGARLRHDVAIAAAALGCPAGWPVPRTSRGEALQYLDAFMLWLHGLPPTLSLPAPTQQRLESMRAAWPPRGWGGGGIPED